MELKEGMYVRTKEGLIHQILDTEIQIKFRFDTGINTPFYENGEYKNQILKASYNIIDIIEVGDYINGWKIHWVDIKNQRLQVYDIKSGETLRMINKGSIKSIVTKEQFESMSYKLGD